jgi:capsular polysaccharide biosynthesis protein
MDPTSDAGFYVRVVRRGWRPILAGLLIGLVAGAALFVAAPRTYAATASVLVTDTGATQTSAVGERTTGGNVNLDTEAQLLKSADVIDRVLSATGDTFSASSIANHVTVQVPANTTVLDITFSASSPERAQAGADAFATAYLANRKEGAKDSLDHEATSYETQLNAAQAEQLQLRDELGRHRGDDFAAGIQTRLQTVSARIATLSEGLVTAESTVVTPGRVINQPALPTRPATPNGMVLLVSGAALGLLAGVGVSIYRERVRPRLDDEDDVRRELQLPDLAEVQESATGIVQLVATPLSPQALSFGQLRRRLDLLHEEQDGVRRIVIASVSSDAAALHTAFNLAWQYAHAGVAAHLVVDGGDQPPGIPMHPAADGSRLLRGEFHGAGLLQTRAPLTVFDLGGQVESAALAPQLEDGVTIVCLRRTSPLVEMLTVPGDVAVLLAHRGQDRAPAARHALKTLSAGGAVHVVGVVLHDRYPPALRWVSAMSSAATTDDHDDRHDDDTNDSLPLPATDEPIVANPQTAPPPLVGAAYRQPTGPPAAGTAQRSPLWPASAFTHHRPKQVPGLGWTRARRS